MTKDLETGIVIKKQILLELNAERDFLKKE